MVLLSSNKHTKSKVITYLKSIQMFEICWGFFQKHSLSKTLVYLAFQDWDWSAVMFPYNNEHKQVFRWLIVIVKKDIWSVGLRVSLCAVQCWRVRSHFSLHFWNVNVSTIYPLKHSEKMHHRRRKDATVGCNTGDFVSILIHYTMCSF